MDCFGRERQLLNYSNSRILPAIAAISLILAGGCVDEGPPRSPATASHESTEQQLTPKSFYLPSTWNDPHSPAPVVDLCYLAADSERLVRGTVVSAKGPIVPADPCDPSDYVYKFPHFEFTVELDDGSTIDLVWLDRGGRPDDVVAGDVLLGGVRKIRGTNLLRRFVVEVEASSQRKPVRVQLPLITTSRPPIPPSCADGLIPEMVVAQRISGEPDVSCGYMPGVPPEGATTDE